MDKEIKKTLIALASIAIIAGAIVGGTYLNKSLDIKKTKENQQAQLEETQKKLEEAQKQIEELSKKLEGQSKKPMTSIQQPTVIRQQTPTQTTSSQPIKKLPPRPAKPEREDCGKYIDFSSEFPSPSYELYSCIKRNQDREKDYQQRLQEYEKMIEAGWSP